MNKFISYHPPSPVPFEKLTKEQLNQIAMDWGEFYLVKQSSTHSSQQSFSSFASHFDDCLLHIDEIENEGYERRKRTFEEKSLGHSGFVSALQYLNNQKKMNVDFHSKRQIEE